MSFSTSIFKCWAFSSGVWEGALGGWAARTAEINPPPSARTRRGFANGFILPAGGHGPEGIPQQPLRNHRADGEIAGLKAAHQLRQTIEDDLALAVGYDAAADSDLGVMIGPKANGHFQAGRIKKHAVAAAALGIIVKPGRPVKGTDAIAPIHRAIDRQAVEQPVLADKILAPKPGRVQVADRARIGDHVRLGEFLGEAFRALVVVGPEDKAGAVVVDALERVGENLLGGFRRWPLRPVGGVRWPRRAGGEVAGGGFGGGE